MCRQHGNDDRVVLTAHGLMDGHSIRQFQFGQAFQRVVCITAIEVDRDCLFLDPANGSNVAIEHTHGNFFPAAVKQGYIVVIFRLHNSVIQPEQLPAEYDLRVFLRRRIDLISDGLVKAIGRCFSFRAEGGKDLYLLHTALRNFLTV